MKLDGFGIAGYRSFGEKVTFINDLAKVNIFIGKNNSGKSNILRFCRHISQFNFHQNYKGFYDIDFYSSTNEADSGKKEIIFALQIKKDSPATGSIYKSILKSLPNFPAKIPAWQDALWFQFTPLNFENKNGNKYYDIETFAKLIADSYKDEELDRICMERLNNRYKDQRTRALEISRHIYNIIQIQKFSVETIEAFRVIAENSNEKGLDSLNGKGLIRALRSMDRPIFENFQGGRLKFKKIESFLKSVLNENELEIIIPADKDDILVSIKGKLLPLDSLGTGIHELIILASAVTIKENVIFCIEEPEIHLHPELQKQFIQYIKTETNNQYLITSHSNAFFDIQGVNIYHCKLTDGKTSVDLAISENDKYEIISDLGYKPSDILLANYIIWVEGPSDRIYLKHWISKKDDKLVEGLHYSIMFYGGKLLSHLSFDDPGVVDFIRLSKINRNAAILIDSDKNSKEDLINMTKQRVRDDFERNDCKVWITEGRAIENYISEEIYKSCFVKIFPSSEVKKWEQFGDLTKINDLTFNKVKFANEMIKHNAEYGVLDLSEKMDGLIELIKKANS